MIRSESEGSAVTAAWAAPRAHQATLGARAQRQTERIEQDRLAGAGLPGQHGEAGGKGELQLFDQNDIAGW